jgi:hypothetical protein
VLRLASGRGLRVNGAGAGWGDGLDSHRGDISGEGSPHRSAWKRCGPALHGPRPEEETAASLESDVVWRPSGSAGVRRR